MSIKHIRMAGVAAAVSAAFAGAAAPASASTTTIYGAGASAVKNAVQLLVLKGYCSTSSTISFYDNGTATISTGAQPGGGTFVIACATNSTSGLSASSIQIGYDTSGGSWKGFSATTSAIYAGAASTENINPIATVSLSCPNVQTGAVMAVLSNTFTINYNWGCSTVPLTPGVNTVTFGLTDVEEQLFTATTDNQPLINGTWAVGQTPAPIFSSFVPGSEYSGANGPFPQQVFGAVMGIGASPNLYSAMQVDQIAAGLLSTTCTAGVASAACAPNIKRSQYASIVAFSGGTLNSSLAPLFTNSVPSNTTFEIVRRDQGSGTQASSNAYFLNDGCTPSSIEAVATPTLPATASIVGATVSLQQTTTNVQKEINAPTLNTTSGFAIGVVSAENDGKWTGGAGFLKLDGYYPSPTNAANGLYSYVTEENLHMNPTITGDAIIFANDLTNTVPGSAKVGESAYNYGVGNTANGIVAVTSNLSTATWGNGGQLCAGWQHL